MHPLNRHLLVVVLCALLPLLLVAAVVSVLLVQEERKATERSLSESTLLLSRAVDAELQRSFAALQALSRSESLRRGDLQRFYDEARDVRDALALWDNVLLLSPKADHLLNLMRPYGTVLPPLPQPEGTLHAARTKTPFVSNVLRGRVDTDWLMYITFPVVHEGEVRYVIGATMNYRYWSSWLARHAPAGMLGGIVDREHVLLARTQEPERFAGQVVADWFTSAARSAPSGIVRGPGLTDPDVVVAFHRSELSGWTTALGTSGTVLDTPMRRTAWAVSLAMLAAVLIAVSLALARAKVVTRGIRALQDGLERLKDAQRLPELRSPVSEIQAAMDAAQASADALAARAERLNRAQEAARLGLFDRDLKTDVLQWSEGMYRLLGMASSATAPSFEWWRSRVVPEDRQGMERRLREAVERGGPFREAFRIRRMDGEVRWLAAIGTVQRQADGAPLSMHGVNIDITARMEAEDLLRQSELKFRTISHAAPMIIWATDPAAQVTFLNERWFEYTGQERSHPLGTWTGAMHPEDRQRLRPQRERAYRAAEPYDGELRLLTAAGEYRWHAFRALPARAAGGEVEQWYGCAVDIHDVKEAQEALREADRRKDEFLATLAHELRNPLAPIRNALQLMKLSPVDDPALRATQDIMERQVRHMVRLIDDLLDVSRITRGRLALRREPIELAKTVQQAIETARPHLTQQLTVKLPAEAVYLDADGVRVAQVLSNLLNNAAKFTPPNGHIEVEASLESGKVAIRVRDDGIGIAAEQLPRLFAMFSQAHSPLERFQGGLGIGLALSRSLVELHGGSIEVHSEGAGKGAEFVVRLPVIPRPDPAAAAPKPAAEPYSGAVRRVLVADDVADNVTSLAALLSMDGNVVEIALDGLDAVRKAEVFKPDLILLDLGMPNLSGVEACRLIRQQAWGKGIVIIALTGWAQGDDRRTAMAAGFDGHLVKPVSYEAIRELLASPLMA